MSYIKKYFGDSEPFAERKPRVWFCAHPNDYPLYLHQVCEKIISMQDCTVFYDEEPEAYYDEEAFLSDLRQMNLFVMPVTSCLLDKPSRAVDVEFKFAMENNIPVLPLMQEAGLNDRFNERFDSLHYLNVLDAEGFDEKLKKYLDNILISQKLINKICREFDAYIFLSYRKVDRSFASELMRLIHENDFCRDVAIWYDEFLVPGENFNVGIENAMDKSDLVVLAITPHILDKNDKNEENYVVRCEYPEASKKHKRILPVRMSEVSRKKLNGKLRSLPDYVNGYNSEALGKALKDAFKGKSLCKNAGDPVHDYLIGLSYLNGIDMEVDRKQGRALIEGAARCGYPDAMEKLISMYRCGDGVKVDYKMSLEWQKKLVERRRKIYEKQKNVSNILLYYDASVDLVNMLAEMGAEREIEWLYERVLADAEEYYKSDSMPFVGDIIAACHEGLGGFFLHTEELERANKHALLALKLYEKSARELADDEDEEPISSGLANTYSLLGRICKGDDGSLYRKKAEEMRQKLISEVSGAASSEELADSYRKLARDQSGDGEFDSLRRSLELNRQIAQRSPTADNRRRVVRDLLEMGENRIQKSMYALDPSYPEILKRNFAEMIKKHYGEDHNMPTKAELLNEAMGYCREAFSIAEEIADQTSTATDLRALAELHDKIGEMMLDISKKTEAYTSDKEQMIAVYEKVDSYYERSVILRERIVAITDSVCDRRDLASSLENSVFGINERNYRGTGNDEKNRQAAVRGLKAVELREEIYRQTESENDKKALMVCYGNMYALYENLGDAEMAAYYKERSNF